ncbi:hypothetical protein CC78DRAFT_615273 [Lojkania enalia]|uniref:Uncharacterized protein n=1 Tax=Lojkania enalia TaxID=147567 RepID=A0A9P4KBG3_9PLEO|nr:hypothetical protein CC78DRAFT_615273 [Didymosphaeria enalia]
MSTEGTSQIIIPASAPLQDRSKSAAYIFIRELRDGATGILPNVLENPDAVQTGWYSPTALSPYPTSQQDTSIEGESCITQARGG